MDMFQSWSTGIHTSPCTSGKVKLPCFKYRNLLSDLSQSFFLVGSFGLRIGTLCCPAESNEEPSNESYGLIYPGGSDMIFE